LGRPAGAWRAFLGLRTSWLSREIVLLGNFLGAALAAATLAYFAIEAIWVKVAVAAAVVNGLAGVFCSAMIYADTRKPLWKTGWTLKRFLGTTLLAGGSGSLLLDHFTNGTQAPVALMIVLFGAALKLSAEKDILGHLYDDDFAPLHKSALLLFNRFGLSARLGKLALIAGGILFPVIGFVTHTRSPLPFVLGTALVLVSEFIERSLFFRAVQGVKMPGQPTS
jgi:DMSO reductase anchor subunit